MRKLLLIAVDLVTALVHDTPFDLMSRIEEAKSTVDENELGPSTRAIVTAAERQGIPWVRADEQSIVRLGYGKHRKYIESTIADSTRLIGVDIAGDKDLTKRFLSDAAIPTPSGAVVCSADEAIAALKKLGAPVAVKPLDGNQGKGVSLNLSTEEQIIRAFDIARGISARVIVEQMLVGRDYRVVVVGGKFVAASERMPAHVWGDGSHTIEELIELENRNPSRGVDHEKPLTKLKVDPVTVAILEKDNRKLEDVPAQGDLVLLRESANLSTGGSARDVTDVVHKTIRRIAERAAAVVGLDVCGIDFVVSNISQPIDPSRGGIVEINAAPGIRMHHHPTEGQARDVGKAIVEMMYPEGSDGRIPLISITGTNGKTTVTRMVAHMLGSTGRTVGMTTTEGISIGGEEIATGDMTGPWSAGVVLSDPTVDIAVLETARGGIFRAGLGYDWSDISVMTNIELDHIGQDGIETIEDLVWIKQLVAERVRKNGTLILNADDERLRILSETERIYRQPKRFVFFSLDSENTHLRKHVQDGGLAYVLVGDQIEEWQGPVRTSIMRASEVPLTLGGVARFQIANTLAAVAACRAAGMAVAEIASAAREFRSEQNNRGRMNFYEVNGAFVLLDYGHNPAALRALCDFSQGWNHGRRAIVLGLPGDRTDALIREAASVAGCGFDQVIIREDKDLRGRRGGEVPELIRGSIDQDVAARASIEIISDETEALEAAIRHATPGDLIIYICEKVGAATENVIRMGGRSSDPGRIAQSTSERLVLN
jgi:cyanophycin synthetase